MADNQVHNNSIFSINDPSKNKRMFSWTVKNYLQRRLLQALDILKISDLDSKLPRKQLSLIMWIKNVHSPVTSPSGVRFLRVLSSQLRCKEQSSSEEIIFTTFPNTTDIKKDTETSQCTAHPLSQSKKEISWWLDNADPFAKPCISMSWKWSPTTSSVTSESNSCCSDRMIVFKANIIQMYNNKISNPKIIVLKIKDNAFKAFKLVFPWFFFANLLDYLVDI